MAVVTVVLFVGLVAAGMVAYRRRRDVWFLVAAGCGVLGILIGLGVGIDTTAGPDILDLGLAATVAVVAAEALGLPASVATRLGVGLRSREWEFDRHLFELLRPLEEATNAPPSPATGPRHEAWRRQFLELAESRIRRLRHLNAPDERWARLAEQYAEIYDRIADIYRSGDSEKKRAEIESRASAAAAERAALRRAYRQRASDVIAGSRMARLMRQPGRRPEDPP